MPDCSMPVGFDVVHQKAIRLAESQHLEVAKDLADLNKDHSEQLKDLTDRIGVLEGSNNDTKLDLLSNRIVQLENVVADLIINVKNLATLPTNVPQSGPITT